MSTLTQLATSVATLPEVATTVNLPADHALPTTEEAHDVTTLWYHGLNGELDERASTDVIVLKKHP